MAEKKKKYKKKSERPRPCSSSFLCGPSVSSSRPSCVSEVRRQDLGQQLEFNGTSDISRSNKSGTDRLHCSIMRRSFHLSCSHAMTVLACVQAWAPSTTTTWRHPTTRLALRMPRPGCKPAQYKLNISRVSTLQPPCCCT